MGEAEHKQQHTPPRESNASSDPATWVDRYGDALFRFALLRAQSRELAEELVQETFLAALRARGDFAGRSSEQTWLIGILRRKIADHFRRASRRQPLDESTAAERLRTELFDTHGIWKVPVPRWPSNPAHTLERREFWDVFDDCVSKLPGALLDAFCLRELEQLPSAEVCEILAISPSNLWTQLHRARMLLRNCLEQNWFHRPAP